MTDHPTPGERAAKALMEAGMLFNDDGDQLTVVDRLRLADIAAIIDAHVSGWRPIDDEAMKENVLVFNGRNVGEAYWYEGTRESERGWWWANTRPDDNWADKIKPTPTHYQPIPPAPKE